MLWPFLRSDVKLTCNANYKTYKCRLSVWLYDGHNIGSCSKLWPNLVISKLIAVEIWWWLLIQYIITQPTMSWSNCPHLVLSSQHITVSTQSSIFSKQYLILLDINVNQNFLSHMTRVWPSYGQISNLRKCKSWNVQTWYLTAWWS